MTRGGAGNMLGVGGSRRNLGRDALRGGPADRRVGGGLDAQAQKRELLRRFQEKQARRGEQEERRGDRTAGDRAADESS
ncbi:MULTISPECIES: DUF6243 family protein [Streptomyces]|uniref:DUF6243 family protein n=1 Tax=Streptomyces griseiscabiei TaxID=2993540 RepID=A0ABU4KWX4_9ACTN|nr:MULTISPECIES: DUF6243 family protein [Streptomyces]MBZ3903332.1 hypothetical protein [Streptomyces griseiscabiei]MDX2907643.1 DUF6243 family protein [Streptomyces griseiscabiei]